MNVCLNCGKYVFDSQNVNEHKRMTIYEYVDSVYRKTIRTNDKTDKLIVDLGISVIAEVNKSECELCGAPHAVLSVDKKVGGVRFFFSATEQPSRKDEEFINHFRRDFFSR